MGPGGTRGRGGGNRPVEYFEKAGGPSLGVFVGEVRMGRMMRMMMMKKSDDDLEEEICCETIVLLLLM
jgi:hypothetical protein